MRTTPLFRILVSTLVASSWLAFAAVAHAHFNLLAPPPADTSPNGGKGTPPCGPTTPASNVVTKVQGGHPLMLSISETVIHPGHYRVALSVNSRSEIPADPAVVLQGQQSVSAAIQNPPVFPVLADGMFVHTTGNAPLAFTGTVMLPNITCAKCTLQVIEFMAMHGPNVGGGYYYHHCADLEITADPALPGADAGAPATDARPADAGVSGTGGGVAATGGRPGGGGGGTGTGGADVPVTGSGGQGTGGASAPVPVTGGNSVGPSTGGAPGTGGGASARTGGASALDAGTGKPPAADSSSGCSIAGTGTDAVAAGYPATLAALAAVLLAWWISRRRRRA